MSVRVLLPILLLGVFASAGAVELTGSNPPDGLRALLAAPTLFGSGACTQRTGGKYPLRVAPDANAAPAGALEADPIAAGQNACSADVLTPRLRKPGEMWTSPVPTREVKPGHPGLIVTDARAGWYQIMLGDGEAWLQNPPGSMLSTYGDIVILAPVHTLRGWDGRVCTTPGTADCRTMALPANPAIRINRMQTINGDLWFKVEFGIGACEGATPPGRDVLSGWIPGYGSPDSGGKRPLTMWVDPHGC